MYPTHADKREQTRQRVKRADIESDEKGKRPENNLLQQNSRGVLMINE